MKISVFRTFFKINFADIELKPSMIVIDQYLTKLWPLNLNFHENLFSADIEVKFNMIVYNNELQIKFEFCNKWSIFDRVMALGFSHISRSSFLRGVF
jgi:hypothetical protein